MRECRRFFRSWKMRTTALGWCSGYDFFRFETALCVVLLCRRSWLCGVGVIWCCVVLRCVRWVWPALYRHTCLLKFFFFFVRFVPGVGSFLSTDAFKMPFCCISRLVVGTPNVSLRSPIVFRAHVARRCLFDRGWIGFGGEG